MLSKRLREIIVSHAPGQVGLSLYYRDGPSEHILLEIPVARDVGTQLLKASEHAEQKLTGDAVGVSDHAELKLHP